MTLPPLTRALLAGLVVVGAACQVSTGHVVQTDCIHAHEDHTLRLRGLDAAGTPLWQVDTGWNYPLMGPHRYRRAIVNEWVFFEIPLGPRIRYFSVRSDDGAGLTELEAGAPELPQPDDARWSDNQVMELDPEVDEFPPQSAPL